ncbi:hypothetical protein BG011_009471 [Mortierella polycephala]|uniref:DUF3844 domain-containing protein n=1 Tax=Mortierella polycephala TaxID=41804 RepID=A0A9P6U7V6_9FUNG|nr:hypothetical protein BG011_009471 [Mortierella polycephala]
MKFLALSVSTVLSTLALTVASAPATVYFFSHGRSSTSNIAAQQDIDNGLPSLTIKETRATLSHLLNLGQVTRDQREGEEAFIDMNGPIQQVFNQPGMSRKDLFERMGGNLVMAIEGVHDPKELMPSYDPAFTMKSNEGVQGLMTELSNRVPFEDRYLFDTHQSSKSGDALVNGRLVAEHHADVDVTVFDLSKKADALFLEESVSLENYLETYEKTHSEHGKATDFVRITLKGLSALAAEHGVDSVQYKTGQQILKEFLQATFIPKFEQIHKTFTTTIFLVAPSTRQESELFSSSSSFRQPLMKRALPASGQCFETAADCETNTNECSQHGACVFSTAANCYHCKCSKINNTQYGGNVCNKVDISIQFHLFFWLGLVLVMTVALAVGLILQMGNQSEGGVPVGPTRAQLKRD